MNKEIVIKPVLTHKDQKEFVELPWKIYRDNPNWIPPLLVDMYNTMNPDKNALLRLGPYRYIIACQNSETVGRLGVGMDLRLNEAKSKSLAYFTLFESVEDYKVTSALFDEVLSWLGEQGAEVVTGPQSPSNGDDYRGLLIDGFNTPPILFNSYNPPYYAEYINRYGFSKQFDRFAYYYDISEGPSERLARGVALAKKRYKFTVRPLNLKKLDREIQIIKKVVDQSMPDWPDMIPPSDEELAAEAEKLKQFAIPDLVLFVENSDKECLGFSVTLPDYNEVLAHLNGRLFPTGFIKFLWLKNKIKGVRLFALFVTAKGRRRGVSAALYYHTMINAYKMGYTHGEGSTIHEFNRRMNLDARKAGGELYKTYRIYQMQL